MTSSSALDPKDFNKIYLNGAYVAASTDRVYTLKNPKDNSIVVDSIPLCGEQDVDLAVKYAEEAYAGEWRSFTAMQRSQCFHALAALLEEKLIPILTLDSLTSGNPVSLIPTREKTYIKNCIMYYSGWTDKQKGDFFPADDGESSTCHQDRFSCHPLGFTKIVYHEPMGVCAAINPFNAPVATLILKAAPALATGNVMVRLDCDRSSWKNNVY